MIAEMSPATETALTTMRFADWEWAETKHAHRAVHGPLPGVLPGVAMWVTLVDRCISAASRYIASTTASFHRTDQLAWTRQLKEVHTLILRRLHSRQPFRDLRWRRRGLNLDWASGVTIVLLVLIIAVLDEAERRTRAFKIRVQALAMVSPVLSRGG